MCFSKRKRTRPYPNASRWMGAPEPCHRLWRCKTEEPRPYGREPWHFVLEKKKNACTLSPCVPLKRKRTTPTNEAKAYTLRKTYLNQYVLLKRINMKNILFVYAFLASGGSREPCHRFQRCKIEEPRPYGREPWHSVLEKLFYLFIFFCVGCFYNLICLVLWYFFVSNKVHLEGASRLCHRS